MHEYSSELISLAIDEIYPRQLSPALSEGQKACVTATAQKQAIVPKYL